jgi:hypothetical protein
MSETQFDNQADEQVYEDYFGFSDTQKWYFPDPKQWIEFRIMDEGARSRFQSKTRRDVTLKRNTGDASMVMDPAAERRELLDSSVVDWNIYQDGQPVKFSSGSPGSTFHKWLDHANPKLVDDLELTIRKANPWMQADMSVEEIDKEIENLNDLRKAAVERQLGEGVSSNR